MTIRDILVHVDDSDRAEIRLDLALQLALRHQAHVIALNVRSAVMPPALAGQFGPGLEAFLADAEAEAARRIQAMVERRGKAAGLAVEWRDATGTPADTLALHARYADLVVVGQADPDDGSKAAAPEQLVLAVGRPVLVVPRCGNFQTTGRRIMVGWNAGREATRAIHDAMPLLERADLVHVIAVNPGHGRNGHGDVPAADMGMHLSRHGVRAVCGQIRSDEVQIGAMMLNRATDEDCDLIVMGAYGHSRLREMVLGGATRHLLAHMTVPVLFSH